jgi:hypothetical protein
VLQADMEHVVLKSQGYTAMVADRRDNAAAVAAIRAFKSG